MESVFIRDPIIIIDDIPVFSREDDYIVNYQLIAEEQIKGIEKSGNNPWIDTELWKELESSTINLIKKYAKPGDVILDVGVGLGRLLRNFTDLDRYGIDISFDLLRIAKNSGIKCSFSRLEDIPFRENMFDIVVCTDVLEHVLDLNYCCKNILNVLKPDGILIIRVPYKEDLSEYISPDYPFMYAHLRSFDDHGMNLLFTRIIRNCQHLETIFSGYINYNARLKFQISFPCRDTLLKTLWNLYRKNERDYSKMIKKLYLPIDFNIVFKKCSKNLE